MADLDFLKLQLLNDPETMQKLQMSMIPMQPQVQGIDTLPNSDAEIKKLIRQKFLESQQLQQQEIEQAKQRLALEQAKQAEAGVLGNLDLRPFAEAARQYGATTAVVPKEAPESNAAMVEKLRQEVIKNQQGMTEDQVKFLRTMMDEKNAKANMQALLSMGNQEIRAYENVARKFQKPQDDLLNFYQRHDAVKRAFDSGDIMSIQTALSQYSRMTGETGALAVSDITRIMPDNLKVRAAQWWSKVSSDPSVKAPEGVIEVLQKNIGFLQNAAENKYKRQLEVAKNQAIKAAPAPYRKFAQPLYDESMQLLKPSESQASTMIGILSDDVIKAEDERRAKAKAASQEKK